MKLPMLHEVLEGAAFCLTIVGAAGLAGTWEQEVTDPTGILLAAVFLVLGIICWIWAGYESGRIRRHR